MSYKELLQKQIKELEEKIAQGQSDKAELEKQLFKLRMSEFEEDLAETQNQTLLKG